MTRCLPLLVLLTASCASGDLSQSLPWRAGNPAPRTDTALREVPLHRPQDARAPIATTLPAGPPAQAPAPTPPVRQTATGDPAAASPPADRPPFLLPLPTGAAPAATSPAGPPLRPEAAVAAAPTDALTPLLESAADPSKSAAAARTEFLAQAPQPLAPTIAPRPLFYARAGSTLQQTLADWAAPYGWRIAWQSNRDYPLMADAPFGDDFELAARRLLEAFAFAQPPVNARIMRGNKVIVVTTSDEEFSDD